MFSDRPLTWLFVIATICVDAVGIFLGDTSSYWQAGYWLGQSVVLGLWFAIGKTHRLARAAIVVVGLALLTWVVCLRQQHVNKSIETLTLQNWGMFSFTLVWSCLFAFLGVILVGFCMRKLRRTPKPIQGREVLRFPLIEFFGWTIVIAVASVFIRPSLVITWQVDWFLKVSLGFSSIVASVLTVLFYRSNREYRFSFVVTIIAVGSFWLYAIWTTSHLPRLIEYAVMQLYVTGWIFVQRLDSNFESGELSQANSKFTPRLLAESVSTNNN